MDFISLPIDKYLPSIGAAIRSGSNQFIIQASPGSGKTTRLPPYLLDHVDGEIWVLEPRRLAAKMSALRIREEQSEKRNVVGYMMRDDRLVSSATRLVFLTDGMFGVKLKSNPNLDGVKAIVIDEIHERHLQGDLALAMILFLQERKRPDLLIFTMSATLDQESLQALMPRAFLLNVAIPPHRLDVQYLRVSQESLGLSDLIRMFCRQEILQLERGGNILCFLPGAFEINRARRGLENEFSLEIESGQIEICELRSTLSRREQERVFAKGTCRKIILATNIAESALTVPGVRCVIDSGLAKESRYDAQTRTSLLVTKKVSQSSLTQRAGRAAREASGICYRLFTENDFLGRDKNERPEIERSDLSSIFLLLADLGRKLGVNSLWERLRWLTSPPAALLNDAKELLERLSFIDQNGAPLIEAGEVGALHPRQYKFFKLLKVRHNDFESSVLAHLADGTVLGDLPYSSDLQLGSDLLSAYDWVRRNQRDTRAERILMRAGYLCGSQKSGIENLRDASQLDIDDALIEAFLDGLCKRRSSGGHAEFIHYSGTIVSPRRSQDWQGWDYLIAFGVEQSFALGSAQMQASPATRRSTITAASGLTPSTASKFGTEQILDATMTPEITNKQIVRKMIGRIVISERDVAVTSSPRLIEESLRRNWPYPFPDDKDLQEFIVKSDLIRANKLQDYSWEYQEVLDVLIDEISNSVNEFSEIKSTPLHEWLQRVIGFEEWHRTNEFAPSQIVVGKGQKVRCNYEVGKNPWIEARLQQFFGQSASPTILDGRLKLTLHLLAPNNRPLQVTSDLASFWRNAYPKLIGEYRQRYPRHFWPENPIEAEPPAKGSLKPRK